MASMFTRRSFLGRGLTGLSVASTMPLFLQRTVLAMNKPGDAALTQQGAGKGEEILVVLQLSGGNDGLSMVVPVDNDDYKKARTATMIAKPLTLLKDGDVGLNPNLTSFKDIFDDGHLALMQGIGYPNPNRSHFRSMEIWQTAEPVKPPVDGWLGRYFDAQCNGADPKKPVAEQLDPKIAINIGNTAPLALHGSKFTAVSFQRPDAYQWFAGNRIDPKMRKTFDDINQFDKAEAQPATSGNPTLDFLERTALDAQLTSDEIRNVTVKYKGGVAYPASALGQQLQMVAQMIAGGLSTRVYYVSMGGFDTHSNQRAQHDRLMTELSNAVGAFIKDLKVQGNFERTLLMTFSEFGRRVTENASRGTDHGTAAPMFVMGGKVKAGVIGALPSLKPADLDKGDLKFHTDFRSVYATLLDQWLKADSKAILGAGFKNLPILA
jgi:uncharacterized protein (DUF1501 family)